MCAQAQYRLCMHVFFLLAFYSHNVRITDSRNHLAHHRQMKKRKKQTNKKKKKVKKQIVTNEKRHACASNEMKMGNKENENAKIHMSFVVLHLHLHRSHVFFLPLSLALSPCMCLYVNDFYILLDSSKNLCAVHLQHITTKSTKKETNARQTH